MNLPFLTRQLTDNAGRIAALVRGVSSDEGRWKPDSASWSVLEVTHHLYDEEREDFRVRLNLILHRPQDPWPAIDPEGWVAIRRYNEQDLEEILDRFLAERQASLAWLGTLGEQHTLAGEQTVEPPNWDAAVVAPFGTLSAGDVFVSWVTHDQLHMRQLIRLHRALTEVHARPYHMDYAGQW